MTEKRFAVTQTVLGSGIYDFQAENELCESYDENAYSKVVKKLNELHKENMMLKGEVAHYKLILLSLEEQAKRLSRIHTGP